MSVNLQYTVESDLVGPSITPISPLPNDSDAGVAAIVSLRIEDPSGVDLSSVIIRVNGLVVFLSSAEQNGATVTVTAITEGFSFAIRMPSLFVDGIPQSVFVSASDILANTNEILYTFFTGIKPRLIDVSNPSPGILIARFNEPMALTSAFHRTQNFSVEPLGNTPSVTILDVQSNPSQPDAAILTFEGGGSLYEMTVTGVTDVAGNPIDENFNTAIFNIGLPGGEAEQIIHVFDSVFGPVGLAQRIVARRTVDRLVINRAIDGALTKQFSQRLESAVGAIPLRSGKEGGKRR